jgi:addiction module HigA family antidote
MATERHLQHFKKSCLGGEMKKREPTSPGEILLEEFLKPMGMTQRQLADHIGCDYKVINRIINQRTSVSPEIALKLAKAFGVTPQFWLNAQMAVDLWRIATEEEDELSKIERLII